jgi:hypothetical protein
MECCPGSGCDAGWNRLDRDRGRARLNRASTLPGSDRDVCGQARWGACNGPVGKRSERINGRSLPSPGQISRDFVPWHSLDACQLSVRCIRQSGTRPRSEKTLPRSHHALGGFGRRTRFNHRLVNGGYRRISPVPPCPREGPLTEPTPAVQPSRREKLFMPLSRPLSRRFAPTIGLRAHARFSAKGVNEGGG